MRRLSIPIVLVLLLGTFVGLPAAQTTERSIQVGNVGRTFRIFRPSSIASSMTSPAPVVFVLHGGGGTGRQVQRSISFDKLADRFRFVVVYPDAIDRNWNDGREAAGIRSQAGGVNDVEFFAAMLDTLSQEISIDQRRIFATGISNGGFMSQRLAVELPNRIAAIAPVAAGMAPDIAARFPVREPVSILVINGTRDPLVPYHGGPILRDRGETIDTDEIIRLWVQSNRCLTPGAVLLLPDRDPGDGTRIRRTTYTRCAGNTEVTLYSVEGGGHTWPGGSQYLPRGIIGRVSRDVDATSVIWEFFAAHPKP